MKQFLDDDVLGTKNVRTKPEYTAYKSTRRVLNFWLTFFPAILLIAVLAFFYIKSDLLFKVADKVAETWSGFFADEDNKNTGKDKTASAEDVLEAYAVASILPLGEHGDGTVEIDANHCCVCCGHKVAHVDKNQDHYCDFPTCNEKYTDCKDDDFDHFCDMENCKQESGNRTHDAFCIDENHNHICDYKDIGVSCDTAFGKCEDLNKNHICDYKEEVIEFYNQKLNDWKRTGNTRPLPALFEGALRSEKFTTAQDELNYIKKTACAKVYGDYKDGDSMEDPKRDHKCDYCGSDHDYPGCTPSKAVNADGDHYCAYCGKVFECKDTNTDHSCDYGCEKKFGEYKDGDSIEDPKRDHKCDYCDGIHDFPGYHIDVDPEKKAFEKADHKCYYCGDTMTSCVDNSKDHFCDICGVFLLDCPRDGMDTNHDHKCDYSDLGCKEKFCAACAEDEDACKGKCEGKCADTVLDHKCDYCRKTLTKCVDENKEFLFFTDLRCDICGKIYYTKLQALLMVAIPLIVICLTLWCVQIAKICRVKKIRIEFYKDIVVYVDKKKKRKKKDEEFQYRTFLGSFSATTKFENEKGKRAAKAKRNNYGTVTVFCPGGPAMSMTFHNIDNPGALVAYLNSKKPDESVSYNASNKDMLN